MEAAEGLFVSQQCRTSGSGTADIRSQRLVCLRRSRPAWRLEEARCSSHAATQLCHSSSGKRSRPAHHPGSTRACGPGSDQHLSAPVSPPSGDHDQSAGTLDHFQRCRHQPVLSSIEAKMSRPAVEVADILRAQGSSFLKRYEKSFSFQQLKAYRAIQNCRTAALGGHLDACLRCGHQAISYNSCRNRHCPKCQTSARECWIAARERELLPTDYFHVVFTLPHELNMLARDNARVFYDLLFSASAQTLLEVAADPRHLGAEIGIISILHTWGQNLLLHPHIHCVIPTGGFSPDHSRWIRPLYPFFLPVKILSRVFRGKFCAGLKRLYRRGRLHCAGPASLLADSQQFHRLLRRLHRQNWVVYAKPAFHGPMNVLRYLGRYTHRIAISNHRLLAFDGQSDTL